MFCGGITPGGIAFNNMAEINLKRNIMVSGGFRIVNMIIILLTSWLSTRYLGVELKGQYSYLVTLVGFIWIVLDMGIHKTYPYLLRTDPDCQAGLFTWTYILFALQIVVVGVLGSVLLPFVSNLIAYQFSIRVWWIFVCLIAFYQLSAHLQMYYLGLDRVSSNSLLQVVYQFILFILVGIALLSGWFPNRLNFFLLAIVISSLIIDSIYSIPFFKFFSFKSISIPFMWKSYKMGIRVFFSTLFITLLLRADVVILKKLSGFSSVGIYSLAAHIVDMLQIASNLVGSLLLVKLADTKDDVVRWVLMKRLFILFFFFISIMNLGFLFFGKLFIQLVYGSSFSGSYYAYLWLIPASFGLSFGSLFNTYLWSRGFPLISVFIPLVTLLVNIGLNFILIPSMDIAGAALASSIA